MTKPLVLYHARCADGFGSAWAAFRRFGSDAEYQPVQHGDSPPDVSGREVYILDFSYPRKILAQLWDRAVSVTILDHHKTAQADLAGLSLPGLSVTFDMQQSGAMLTWRHFFPDEPPPFLIELVQDRDLWRHALPYSRELNAWLSTMPRTFAAWDNIAEALQHPDRDLDRCSWVCNRFTQDAQQQGAAVLRYQARQVEEQCAHASEIDLDGYRILAVNATALISEIAGQLAVDRPCGATFFIRPDGRKVWSLRSDAQGIDVSEIARKHGGGGHIHAAGYTEST